MTRRAFGLGDVMALATVVLWGVSFTVIKSAYDEFTPLAFAGVRFVIASLALLAVLALLRQPLSVRRHDLPRLAAVGLFHVAFYQIFFGIGLKYTTASNSVLIINTAPVITALLVWTTRSEPITWRQTTGIALAAAGVILLVEAGGSISGVHLKGDVITLLAALSYAVTPVIILPLYQRYSSFTIMAYGMVAGTIVLLAVGLPEIARQSWAVSRVAWAQLAYAALGAGTMGYLFWYEGIRRIGPTRATAYFFLIPPVGVITAVAVLHEPFGTLHLVGAVVIIAGVALTRWPAPRAQAAERR